MRGGGSGRVAMARRGIGDMLPEVAGTDRGRTHKVAAAASQRDKRGRTTGSRGAPGSTVRLPFEGASHACQFLLDALVHLSFST
jgi:hypothetical protein